MNKENLVQKYFHTSQMSWFTRWGILIWITLYTAILKVYNSIINLFIKRVLEW